MIPEAYCANVRFTPEDVKDPGSVCGLVVLLFELRQLFPKAQNLTQVAIVEEKNWQVIWRAYFLGKTAEWFHRR